MRNTLTQATAAQPAGAPPPPCSQQSPERDWDYAWYSKQAVSSLTSDPQSLNLTRFKVIPKFHQLSPLPPPLQAAGQAAMSTEDQQPSSRSVQAHCPASGCSGGWKEPAQHVAYGNNDTHTLTPPHSILPHNPSHTH